MSATIREVIEAGGYDLTKIEDMRWVTNQMHNWDDLLEECLNKVEEYDDEMAEIAEREGHDE